MTKHNLNTNHYPFRLCFVLAFIILAACPHPAPEPYNLSFEHLDSHSMPVGWSFSSPESAIGTTSIDSIIHHDGKYAVKINGVTDAGFISIKTMIPALHKGQTAHLTGYLRSDSASNGGGILWLRIEDSGKTIIGFKNTFAEAAKGTTAWKKYSLSVAFDPKRADKIYMGAGLMGKGTLWVDDLHFTVTNDSIADYPGNTYLRNTSYSANIMRASAALSQRFGSAEISDLALAGKIWGFLKYYHPAITTGRLDWDSVLFSILPKLNGHNATAVFQKLLDELPPVTKCPHCSPTGSEKLKAPAGFGGLFGEKLPASFREKLLFLKDNFSGDGEQFYVTISKTIGNPSFANERTYGADAFPPAALRLLTLFRYWNIVEYYYPYKYSLKGAWDTVLPSFIPRFLAVANTHDYLLTCLDLITRIRDSHAYLQPPVYAADSLWGKYITPFQARVIQDRLVVTGYYTDPQRIKDPPLIGDIIETIDGTPVDSLVSRYLPYTPGSNLAVQLHNLSSVRGFLLRSNKDSVELTILRGQRHITQKLRRIPIGEANTRIDYTDIAQKPAFELLKDNIGYINPGKLTSQSLDTIRKLFQHTRGLIVDLRCYPSAFIPYTFGTWLKSTSSPFARFTTSDPKMPGNFIYAAKVSNGGPKMDLGIQFFSTDPTYTGKLIIIVNATTISQAEFTAMALRTTPGSLIVGSTTAGADGNLSQLVLPGSISTAFSGTGVYYPDGQETQHVGVKIDVPVQSTKEGIAEGKDEYLLKALQLLKQAQ